MMKNEEFLQFKNEIRSELDSILAYWKTNSVDTVNGGFYGRRDFNNNLIADANKGVILNTRLLWSFSAAGNFYKNDTYKTYADRAYAYLKTYFQDQEFEGLYWELDHEGNPVNKRKQIYAQAFSIYALSEFYRYTSNEDALNWAISLFNIIEKYARDNKLNGYLEAFQENWSPIEDMRLSEKDDNSAKTMNTHLHILEAYTNLLQVTGSSAVKEALKNLTKLFLEKFLDTRTNHFQLFFDTQWKRANNVVSFGHDIEAVWLIVDACKAIANKDLLQQAEQVTLEVASTFLKEAYIPQKGVVNEQDMDTGEIDTDRHWWPQMEAIVGLQYAFEISGEEHFRTAQLDIWQYTKNHIIDHKNGEWHFRVNKNNEPYTSEDKLSMWKAPYHNSRACMLVLN